MGRYSCENNIVPTIHKELCIYSSIRMMFYLWPSIDYNTKISLWRPWVWFFLFVIRYCTCSSCLNVVFMVFVLDWISVSEHDRLWCRPGVSIPGRRDLHTPALWNGGRRIEAHSGTDCWSCTEEQPVLVHGGDRWPAHSWWFRGRSQTLQYSSSLHIGW